MLQPLQQLLPVGLDGAACIDAGRLLRWHVYMQGMEAELGGLQGHTNKLVDSCYSWWVGGASSLLEALGVPELSERAAPHEPGPDKSWDDIDGVLCLPMLTLTDHCTQNRRSTAGRCKSNCVAWGWTPQAGVVHLKKQ